MTVTTAKSRQQVIFLITLVFLITAPPLFAGRKEISKNAPETLTLPDAIKRTLIHNRNLRKADLNVKDSRLGLASARSDFDIKITPLSTIGYSSNNDEDDTTWSIGGNMQKKYSSGIILKISPSIETSDDSYTSGAGLSLTIPLLRGYGKQVTLNSLHSSEYALASSYRSLHANRVTAVLEVISTVYNVLREQQLVELYNEQTALLEHHLSILKVKEKTGLVTLMDIYRARLRLKDVQQNLSLAGERVKDNANRLKVMVGIPTEKEIVVTAPLEYSPVIITPAEAIKVALNKRVEIDQARADIQESRRQEAVARHNTLPDLTLTSEYTRQETAADFENSFGFGEDVFSVQISSNSDFFRNAEKTTWSRAKLEIKRKQLNLEETIENMAREIRNLLNGLEKSNERIKLRKEQIHQAGGKQELARIKFKYGEADNFNLIEAQNELQRAKVNYLTEKIQYIIDTYRLQAALGTLLDYRVEDTAKLTSKPN